MVDNDRYPCNWNMATAVTHDIKVTARVSYEAAHSDPRAQRFLFSYRITIANLGKETVQLLRRHWLITDSLAPAREVEGPGVVGETPVLAPGESYTYTSACDLRSGLGRMEGEYLMAATSDGRQFSVTIPAMHLQHPPTLN
jgi:ApaG protein